MHNHSIIALLLLCILGVDIYAQKLIPNEYEVEMLAPEILSTHDGIQKIFQDKKGYLWFTSFKGLTCYDGQNFVTYNNAGNEHEMVITEEGLGFISIECADSIHMWVEERTTYDLILFNAETRKQIRRIKRDRRGSEHMSVANGEIYTVFSTKEDPYIKFQKLGLKEDGPIVYTQIKNDIQDTYEYYKEYLFIKRRNNGIVQVDLKGNTVRKIQPEGLQIIHKSQEGLYFSKGSSYNSFELKNPNDSLRHFLETPDRFTKSPHCFFKIDNQIWCSDYFRGVYLYDKENNTIQDYGKVFNEIASKSAPSTLKMQFFYAKKINSDQILISGFNYIYILKPKNHGEDYFKEKVTSGEELTSMRGIVEDEVGNIYASYYTGISKKEKGSEVYKEFQNTINVPKSVKATYDLSLKDSLLFWDHSKLNLNSGTVDHFYRKGFGGHAVHLLEEDTMWIAFWNSNKIGKYIIPQDSFQMITEEFYSSEMQFSDFILTKEKDGFYLATNYQGILRFDRKGNTIDTLMYGDLSMPENGYPYIQEMHLMNDSLWYGTPQGLGVLDVNTMKSTMYECPIIYKDGLSTLRNIYTILPDDKDNFYLGTSHGLIYFNPRSKTFFQLDTDHPFYLKEFNRSSTLKASNGKYYMGTVNGLYSFYPEELKFSPISNAAALPFLNQISIKNKREEKSRTLYSSLNKKDLHLKLQPNDYNLNIHFSATNFDQAVYYSYRIREFGETWNTATTNSYFEIYSLPPGRFTLDIQSTLDPKFESNDFLSIKISKARIWYQRWWVIALFVMVIIGAIAAYLKLRFQRKLERQKEMAKLRTNISSDLHDDVGSILAGLALQSDLMRYESKGDQKEKLTEMANMSRTAMDKMRDTVWAIDSRKDKYIDLIQRMQHFAERTLSKKDIEYTFQMEGIEMEAMINPERRQNLFLIFKEAITNIMKHSDGDHVKISFIKAGKVTRLKIHDNGSPIVNIQTIKSASGLGTSNIQMRANRLGGEVEFRNENGFTVEVILND